MLTCIALLCGLLLSANTFASTPKSNFRAGKLPATVTAPTTANAWWVGGDFSLDFVAAAPKTYNHFTGGGAFDDRTVGVDKDIVESLEGGDFKCEDIVTYFTEIVVADGAVGSQTIELDYSFLADATGSPGVAHSDIIGVKVNYGDVGGDGPGGTDAGIKDDGGSTATIVPGSETFTKPIYTKGSELLGSVTIDDLEAGERVIVRIDVRISCDDNPNTTPTGNLQASIIDADVIAPSNAVGNINAGNQTVPFQKLEAISPVTCSLPAAGPVCEGTTTTHTATSDNTGASYAWSITGSGVIVVGGTDVTSTTTTSAGTTSSVDVRATGPGTYTLTVTISKPGFSSRTCTITVSVTDNPDLTTAPTTVCEDGTSGGASVDLASLVNADGGTLTFYASQADATAGSNAISNPINAPVGATTYWVRSANGSCFGIASVLVTVTDNPDVTTTPTTAICEGSSINLASLVTQADGGTLTFHSSQADANAGTNALSSSTVSPTDASTTYWVRSTTTGGCFGIASLIITITDNPDVITTPTTVCENGTTGVASVNLALLVDPDGGTPTFYTSSTDANNGTNAISSTVNAPVGATTYWVRSANGSCVGVGSVLVTVTDNPDLTVTPTTTLCEGSSINLNTLVTEADAGTVTFHSSLADAQSGANPLTQPVSPTASSTTYWVRSQVSVNNVTCHSVASVAVQVDPYSKITLQKLTNGIVDITKSYTFAIYNGPKGFNTTPIASQTTSAGNNSLLFDGLTLSANHKYTLCELNIPSGYSVVWQVDNGDGTFTDVPLYDPNVINGGGDYNQGEAVGNLCMEFGAGTDFPLPLNTYGSPTVVKLRFRVNNTFPQGTARTPGYWKNWSSCTGGKQVETALKNGGKAAGFYILDDHLPHTLWSNPEGKTGCTEFKFGIGECAAAVKILSTQDASGKQKASDAAYNLAKHLMAYQLNIKSGTAPCASAADAAMKAEALLASLCFKGTGDYLKTSSTKRTEALSYAKILDAYNNNLPCGSVGLTATANTSTNVKGAIKADGLSTEVYPNPTSSDATITFSVAKTGYASVDLYNAIGAKVATLYDGQVVAGKVQSVSVKGANLPSGTYFYRVSSDGKTKTNRFLIAR